MIPDTALGQAGFLHSIDDRGDERWEAILEPRSREGNYSYGAQCYHIILIWQDRRRFPPETLTPTMNNATANKLQLIHSQMRIICCSHVLSELNPIKCLLSGPEKTTLKHSCLATSKA